MNGSNQISIQWASLSAFLSYHCDCSQYMSLVKRSQRFNECHLFLFHTDEYRSSFQLAYGEKKQNLHKSHRAIDTFVSSSLLYTPIIKVKKRMCALTRNQFICWLLIEIRIYRNEKDSQQYMNPIEIIRNSQWSNIVESTTSHHSLFPKTGEEQSYYKYSYVHRNLSYHFEWFFFHFSKVSFSDFNSGWVCHR